MFCSFFAKIRPCWNHNSLLESARSVEHAHSFCRQVDRTCADKLSPLGIGESQSEEVKTGESQSEEVKTGESRSEERKQPKDCHKDSACIRRFSRARRIHSTTVIRERWNILWPFNPSSLLQWSSCKCRMASSATKKGIWILWKFLIVGHLSPLGPNETTAGQWGRANINDRTGRKDSLAHVF